MKHEAKQLLQVDTFIQREGRLFLPSHLGTAQPVVLGTLLVITVLTLTACALSELTRQDNVQREVERGRLHQPLCLTGSERRSGEAGLWRLSCSD